MKKLIINLVKIVVTFGILWWIFRKFQIGIPDIAAAFKQEPAWFAVSFLMQCGAVLFSILRWNLLLKGQDLHVPFLHVFRTFLVGRFLGTFTPTGVGLEAYKAYDIARYTGHAEESVSVVLIEKMIGTFFSLSLLVLITLPFFLGSIDARFLYVFGALFVLLLILALILLFSPNQIKKLLGFNFPWRAKVGEPLNKMVDAFSVYSRRRGSLIGAILLGLVVYIFWFLTYYTNSRALGCGIALTSILLVGPMTQLLSMLPLTIAGVGLREKAFSDLLVLLGAITVGSREAKSAVLAMTMVYFVSISVNIIGAIIFLTRKTDYQQQMADMKKSRGPKSAATQN